MRACFAVIAALTDVCAITSSAISVGVAYHSLYYHTSGRSGLFAELGLLMALLFVIFNVTRDDYNIADYLTFAGHARRTLFIWNMTCLMMLVVVFAIKQTADYSRVSLVLIYIVGFCSLVVLRSALIYKVRTLASIGKVSTLRIVLVGEEAELRDFALRYEPWTAGIDVVAAAVLRGPETLRDDLTLAAASARVLRPDDIFILVPWTESATIETCIAAFSRVPAAIHLGAQPVLDHFVNARVSRIGGISSLHLVRQPLTLIERITKRAIDLIGAILLLVTLLPVFLLIAIAIKCDSHGPVFFVQRRYGFNQQTFRIVKFRSMTVAEDDRRLLQASRNDPRVTRLGRVLRRYNLDELPQLLNVLRGEMSLVGPRPHALAHNQQFERSIADYARRHNVKPGITGWAQIHGLRGEITSDSTIRARVDHDLYYIDNWTLGLDLRILAGTLLWRAFENAY